MDRGVLFFMRKPDFWQLPAFRPISLLVLSIFPPWVSIHNNIDDWKVFGPRYFVNKAIIAIIASLNSLSISIFRGTTQISPTSSSSSLTLVFKSSFSFLSSSSLAPGHLGIEPFSSYVSRITLFLIGEYFTPARRFSSSHCFFSSSLCLRLIIWIN